MHVFFRIVLCDGRLHFGKPQIGIGAEEGIIIEIRLLRGNAEHTLHSGDIRTGFACHPETVQILSFPRMDGVEIVDQLIVAAAEFLFVLRCPPVDLVAVLVVLRAPDVKRVGDLVADDGAELCVQLLIAHAGKLAAAYRQRIGSQHRCPCCRRVHPTS